MRYVIPRLHYQSERIMLVTTATPPVFLPSLGALDAFLLGSLPALTAGSRGNFVLDFNLETFTFAVILEES